MIPNLNFILNQINSQLPDVSKRVKRAATENEDFTKVISKKFKTKEFSVLDYEPELFDILREYNQILNEQLELKANLKKILQYSSDDELTNNLYHHPMYLESIQKLYPLVDKISRIYQLILLHEKETKSEMDVDNLN